jgi:hypothetical protein
MKSVFCLVWPGNLKKLYYFPYFKELFLYSSKNFEIPPAVFNGLYNGIEPGYLNMVTRLQAR